MTRALRTALVAFLCLGCLVPAAGAEAPDFLPVPGLRITGGPVWHLDPERDVVGAVDVLPNIQLLFLEDGAGFYLTGLLGYGFEGGGDTHLFQLGVDVGILPSRHFGASLGLRGVMGSTDGAFGGGGRVIAGVDLWYGVFRMEGGYQVLDGVTGTEHDVRFTAGVDLLRLIVAPFLIMAEKL